MTIFTFVFLGHLQNMQICYMQQFQPVRSNIDQLKLITAFIYIACIIQILYRFYRTGWWCKLGFGLSYALGDLAITRTSEITLNLSSQKVVGKCRPTVQLEHPDSFSQ